MALLPAINYTNKDYASLRQAMLDLARYRLPEWTDQSPSDLGVLLVDLFAYMGDIILYYQDRIANESFLRQPLSGRACCDAATDWLRAQAAGGAAAELSMTFRPPSGGAQAIATIPHGAQFATGRSAAYHRSSSISGRILRST